MRTRALSLFCAAFFILVSARAFSATNFFGPASTTWGTGAAWSLGIPVAGQDIVIKTGSVCTITAGSTPLPSFNSLTVQTGATLSGGNFNFPVTGNTNPNAGATVSITGTASFLALNMSGVGATLSSSSTIASLTISGGSITLNNSVAVGITIGSFTETAGSFDVTASNYPVSIGGNWNRSGGTFNPRNGTVTFTATASIQNAETFYNLTISSPAVVTAAGAMTMASLDIKPNATFSLNGNNATINGALTIEGSGFAYAHVEGTGVLVMSGTETVSGTGFTFGTSTGTVRYLLTANLTTALSLGLSYYNVELDNTSNYTWTLTGNLTASNMLCVHSGTIATNGHNVTAGAMQIDGGNNLGTPWGGILQGGAGTITINGTTTFINNFTQDGRGVPPDGGNGLPAYPALTGGSGALAFNGSVTGAGAFTASSTTTTFTGGSLVLYDSTLPASGTFTATSGTVVFSGTGSQTEYVNGASFVNLTVQGGMTLQAVNNSAGGANALNVTGTLTISTTSDLMDALGQNFTITTLAGSGILALNDTQATQTVSSGVATGGTIRYEGSSGGTIHWTAFSNIEIKATAGTTFTTSGNTTTANNCNVLLTSGNLQLAAGNSLTLGASGSPGNLVFQGGTLDLSLLANISTAVDVWGNIGGPVQTPPAAAGPSLLRAQVACDLMEATSISPASR